MVMLVTIKGTANGEIDGMVVLEVNGLGYGLHMADSDRTEIKKGDEVTLYLYEHIREDAHDLYAFKNPQDQWLFRQLISVSGVGPKLALTVISGVGSKQLRQAIISGNSEVLQSVPGVGKRTAERLVVELKNKLGEALESSATASGGGEDTVFAALRQLGYPPVEAQQAAGSVPAEIDGDEARLKHALKELAK